MGDRIVRFDLGRAAEQLAGLVELAQAQRDVRPSSRSTSAKPSCRAASKDCARGVEGAGFELRHAEQIARAAVGRLRLRLAPVAA